MRFCYFFAFFFHILQIGFGENVSANGAAKHTHKRTSIFVYISANGKKKLDPINLGVQKWRCDRAAIFLFSFLYFHTKDEMQISQWSAKSELIGFPQDEIVPNPFCQYLISFI